LGIPNWTGFTIGYHIVNDYHPGLSWEKLTLTSATTILVGSHYQPCRNELTDGHGQLRPGIERRKTPGSGAGPVPRADRPAANGRSLPACEQHAGRLRHKGA